MKFVIAFSLCSAINGFCGNTAIYPKKFNTWSECNQFGTKIVFDKFNQNTKKFNDEKLYLVYFCNENYSNQTSAQSFDK